MAARGRQFWASDYVHGPGGRFRVLVTRLAAAGSVRRDSYSASLVRKGSEGDEIAEAEFWQNSAPPHDAEKLAFRERARRAAQQPAPAGEEVVP